tara:strand:+ start:1104 stop:3575 length:2472 start_codon:yes stop_codon:yes gene_type:complete
MKNKLIDYISGNEIISTPEEVDAVQVFSKQLVKDYGYPKENIQTRPQYRVKCRPSDTKKEYPVDIAVFNNSHKTEENINIIVECKKKNRKDGITQLKDYLRFSNSNLGVWFNGDERVFLKKIEEKGKIFFEDIPNIPQYGQRVEDIGQLKRGELKVPHNLKSIFKAIRNHLAGNFSGATRDEELARELINLIFCKIYDEKFTDKQNVGDFRVGHGEDPNKVKNRIDDLFTKVKHKYRTVIDQNEVIKLDKKALVYIIGELQNYCLIDSERDVIADAFETFIGYALKGAQGQFFTPRNIVQLMIKVLNPKIDEKIIDPACGSGGFLVESLKYVWKEQEKVAQSVGWNKQALNDEQKEVAINNFRGIEKDNFLSKVAKAYMAILGDGKGGIFCEDSLEIPKEWKSKTRLEVKLGGFDVLVTNPPFGQNIKVDGEEKLQQYDFGYKWKKDKDDIFFKTNNLKKNETIQIIFIERALQLLRDGGRMGIVLPETIFHAPNSKYILSYLLKNHNITTMIDLPHNTFRPYCNAKSVIMFLEKNVPQQSKIKMGVAIEMGHNHQGKIMYRYDEEVKEYTDVVWDDTKIVQEEIVSNEEKNNTFSINYSDIKNNIFVPRYYWDKYTYDLKIQADKKNMELVQVQDLLKDNVFEYYKGHGSPKSEYKGLGDIPYVRAGDIVDWEIYKNPLSGVTEKVYNDVTKNGVKLIKNDIVFVKEGSYRVGDVAILSEWDTKILLNHHSFVFRTLDNNKHAISPYYLLFLFTHPITKKQLYNKVMIDTTLPNIGYRWKELLLPIEKDKARMKEISNSIQKLFEKRWETQKEIIDIRNKYN